ncbi:MAG: IS91 family transposase, partial [Methyloprofundus sp.]|nr:IS91 family transposase [Methyloprofundus sp.]
MFFCVSSTLKDFGLNPKNLGAEIGMTAVLHTHNRKLDYHPHIHVIIPGGGICYVPIYIRGTVSAYSA